jgi:hypothetical protein
LALLGLLTTLVLGNEPDQRSLVEFDLAGFHSPTAEDRQQIRVWIEKLEQIHLLADQVGFEAAGFYFIAAEADGQELINAMQFAYGWCIDNLHDRERIVFRERGLLPPEIVDHGAYEMVSSGSSAYDRLRLGHLHFDSPTTDSGQPIQARPFASCFEHHAVCFPASATVSGPIGIYRGRAFDKHSVGLPIEQLHGVQRCGSATVALFLFEPTPSYVFFRAVVFRDGVPVQAADSFSGRRLRRSPSGELQPVAESTAELQAELVWLKQHATPTDRTVSRWTTLGQHAVPASIHSVTLLGPHTAQFEAHFEWKVNGDVSERAFSLEDVGQSGPFSFLIR